LLIRNRRYSWGLLQAPRANEKGGASHQAAPQRHPSFTYLTVGKIDLKLATSGSEMPFSSCLLIDGVIDDLCHAVPALNPSGTISAFPRHKEASWLIRQPRNGDILINEGTFGRAEEAS
jgi:hypothetical protein